MKGLRTSTFMAPRSAYNKVVSQSNFNYLPFEEKDPGPGYYSPDTLSSKKSASKFTMRPKTTKHCKSK